MGVIDYKLLSDLCGAPVVETIIYFKSTILGKVFVFSEGSINPQPHHMYILGNK